MFDYMITLLAPKFAAEIRDLILTPPAQTPYDVLKETLIKWTAAFDQQHLQQLFSAEELGDRKLTQLLRHLQQLSGDTPGADGYFLQELFLQCLLSNVRMVLASMRNDTPINELAQLADKIMEVAIPEVANVSVQLNPSEIESLRAEIINLKQQLNSRKKVSCCAHLTYHRRPTIPVPPPQESFDELCWYCRTFGDSANKCQTLCSYQGNGQASRRWQPVSLANNLVAYFMLLTPSLAYASLWIQEQILLLFHLLFLSVNTTRTLLVYRQLITHQ